MRYILVKTRRFKTAYKRVKHTKGFKRDVFIQVITTLASGDVLSPRHRDHALTGSLRGFRECHVTPDILLIYQIDNDVLVLTLVSVGNHSQLFG